MILGGIQINKIQALVCWVRDRQNLGQPIYAALCTDTEMMNAGIVKRIENNQPKADMKAADLTAFNPDEFETHEDAFRNLLSQTIILPGSAPYFIFFVRRWLQSYLQITLKSACSKCHLTGKNTI